MFETHDHLGGRAYYCIDGSVSSCFRGIDQALDSFNILERLIDPVAVLGVLKKNYPLADRTMIQGLCHSPWMARVCQFNNWEFAKLPKHGTVCLAASEIASGLGSLLYKEALHFLSAKKTVGILLSGGMDSRVVAGVVRQVQLNGDYSGDVIALTWGVPSSRDVIYAEKIAQRFGWEFKCFPLDAEILYENITLAGLRGAEFSPVHLHAMSTISGVEGLDGILAGSYGDSIGRGEYSGRRIHQLPDILSKDLNHFSFLLKSIEMDAIVEIKNDLRLSRERYPDRSEIEYREIEMQMHYMRRQLNSCMSVIDDNVPLYQMFTQPNVFGYMWLLDSCCRNDDVYQNLLANSPGQLLNIPWARTGRIYNHGAGVTADDLLSLNNQYGKWLRNDCRDFIVQQITKGSLQSLGIFNQKALAMWVNKWPRTESPKADRLDEKMAWLASLAVFVDRYNIRGGEDVSHSYFDSFSEYRSLVHTWLYHKIGSMIKK